MKASGTGRRGKATFAEGGQRRPQRGALPGKVGARWPTEGVPRYRHPAVGTGAAGSAPSGSRSAPRLLRATRRWARRSWRPRLAYVCVVRASAVTSVAGVSRSEIVRGRRCDDVGSFCALSFVPPGGYGGTGVVSGRAAQPQQAGVPRPPKQDRCKAFPQRT